MNEKQSGEMSPCLNHSEAIYTVNGQFLSWSQLWYGWFSDFSRVQSMTLWQYHVICLGSCILSCFLISCIQNVSLSFLAMFSLWTTCQPKKLSYLIFYIIWYLLSEANNWEIMRLSKLKIILFIMSSSVKFHISNL